MSASFELPLKTLKALSLYAVDSSRPSIYGVIIDSTENPVAVSTDGHRLLAVRLSMEGDYSGAFLVPAGVVKQALALKSSVYWLRVQDSEFVLECGMYKIGGDIKPSDLNWRKVVPAETSGEPAHFNAKYLVDAAEVHRLLTGDKSHVANFSTNGQAPALWVGSNHFQVLMPVRGIESSPKSAPDWI